jgi:hypothetical protein
MLNSCGAANPGCSRLSAGLGCAVGLLLAATSILTAAPDTPLTVTVERASGEQWRPVDAATVFKAGEEVRFRIRPGFAGYIYVLNETAAGERMWIFPPASAPRSNSVVADRDYVFPDGDGALQIPDRAGYDFVYVILTSVRLPAMPPVPPRIERPVKNTLLPRCKEGPLRARGVCLDETAGARPVDDPKRVESITKMVRGDDARSAGQIVVHELRLAHR